MDKVEKLIKGYLERNLHFDSSNKTADCLSEQDLLDYLEDRLESRKRAVSEHHIAGCGFCLSTLSLLFESRQKNRSKTFAPVPQKLLNKTKSLLGIGKDEKNGNAQRRKAIKRRIFLAGTIVFFVLSFFIPRYFMQFLVGALILGIRWSFESEGGRTLIMVLDSWRRRSHDKDDEISRHLKNRL
jgi:hypothetical protein